MCAPSTPVVSCCQICFDEVPAREPEPETCTSKCDNPGFLATQICGPQCEAQICQSCLTRHVQVSLERFYAGVVPKVRCPICLIPMLKSQWQIHLEDNKDGKPHELVQRFETLCKQACGLTAPCCHKADYSHLPGVACHSKDEDAAEVAGALMAVHPEAQEHIEPLWTLCQDFHSHKKVAARTVVEFVLQHFGDDKALDVMDQLLPRLRDDERRSTLQLAYLFVRPSVWSRCCGTAFCFNCKRKEHHEVCDQGQAVDLDTCLVQCRSCRAMLLKVDGCAIVSCLCGFSMNWDTELTYKDLHQKQLTGVDIFDTELFDIWVRWKYDIFGLGRRAKQAYLKFRQSRLDPWMSEYKPVLREHIGLYIWRRRFSNSVIAPLPWDLRCKQFALWVENHKCLVQTTFVRSIWQHRFTRDVVPHIRRAVRRKQMNAWIQSNKPLLQRTLGRFMCQKRFSKRVIITLSDEVNLAKSIWVIKRVRPQLRGMVANYIWRRRFEKLVIEPNHIFWAVYKHNHREEAQELAEEESAMFNMDFDED